MYGCTMAEALMEPPEKQQADGGVKVDVEVGSGQLIK